MFTKSRKPSPAAPVIKFCWKLSHAEPRIVNEPAKLSSMMLAISLAVPAALSISAALASQSPLRIANKPLIAS